VKRRSAVFCSSILFLVLAVASQSVELSTEGVAQGTTARSTFKPAGKPQAGPLKIDAGAGCIVELIQSYDIQGTLTGTLEVDYRIMVLGPCGSAPGTFDEEWIAYPLDMGEVRGQESARRSLLVAAAGGHHLLMVGPPGAGKTMLARRFGTLLPPLSEKAALETTMIYSIVGLLDGRGLITESPFRAPHHSASDAGLIGGGSSPRPGEVTLAHNGVLFLDELPEFKRHVLETLREPIEEGRITISRAKCAVTFPARFQLIAAMNPCPCGYHGSSQRQCRCSPLQIEKYLSKISGPLLDRISIHMTVRPVDIDALSGRASGESSDALRERAVAARAIQSARFAGDGAAGCNAGIPEGAFASVCPMTEEASELLVRAHKSLRISARGRAHVIRVSRTIADLEGAETITEPHVAEAVQYRVPEVR
jgi:magnesium chelatase family protein